jgi:hypothetical protein
MSLYEVLDHVEAQVSGAIILAAVLLKLGRKRILLVKLNLHASNFTVFEIHSNIIIFQLLAYFPGQFFVIPCLLFLIYSYYNQGPLDLLRLWKEQLYIRPNTKRNRIYAANEGRLRLGSVCPSRVTGNRNKT